MPAPPPIISTTTPLAANAVYTSSVQNITRATAITGSVFADEPGTLVIGQGGDGTHFDIQDTYNIPANTGVAIDLSVYDAYIQATYTNGATAQTAFRLFVNLQDAYGAFLGVAAVPTLGGAYAILFETTGNGNYSYVGRFDGTDPLDALKNAAVFNNKNGQYAAFPVVDAIVANETIIPTTDYSLASF